MRISVFVISILMVACGPATQQKRIQRTFELANQKLEEGYYNEAISLYSQVIEKNPQILDAFMNRGVAYFESGRYALALADYNHVYFNYPDYSDVLFNRVYCHLELHRLKPAREDIYLLKKMYPDSALIDVIEGLYWDKRKNYDNAVRSFESAISKDSMNFDAWSNRGIMAYHQKDFDLAEKDLKKALEIHENEPFALNALALNQATAGKYNEADSLIDMAIRLIPDQAYFINNKGFVETNLGNYDQADSLFRMSLLLDGSNPYTYKNLGRLRLAQDRQEDAFQFIVKSLELDPTLVETRELLEQYATKYRDRASRAQVEELKTKYLIQ